MNTQRIPIAAIVIIQSTIVIITEQKRSITPILP